MILLPLVGLFTSAISALVGYLVDREKTDVMTFAELTRSVLPIVVFFILLVLVILLMTIPVHTSDPQMCDLVVTCATP